MATSKVKILSAAFILLGKDAINDIVSTDKIVIAASQVYDYLKPDLLTAFPWRFAMLTRELNKLSTTPPVTRFANAFQLPPDMLLAYRPEDLINYEIYEDMLYTNNSQVKLDYIHPATENEFPPYFVRAINHTLAAEIAMTVTQTITIAEYWEKISERSLIRAKARDSQQMPNPFVRRDPLITARFSGGRVVSGGSA